MDQRTSLKEVINSEWLKGAVKREFERNSFLINKEKEKLKVDAIYKYIIHIGFPKDFFQ
jgi:hypothetical protein